MIKDYSDNKTTPKKYAQDLILTSLSTVKDYWTENDSDNMTQREIDLVNDQLIKECDRIAKRFGYDKSW